jgi:hypothetical protein
MLGIYEFPGGAAQAELPPEQAAYPKEFVIDYFRAYQRSEVAQHGRV